jgi:Family of unknown function (DUF6058)
VAVAPARMSVEDDRYIRAHFVNIEWLAAKTKMSLATFHQWQWQNLFPQPTYVTEDGEQWYPRSYAGPIQRAKSLKTDLRTLFQEDYKRALEQLRYVSPVDYYAELAKSAVTPARPEDVIELEWQAFLSGQYGVCLRIAWVPCILRKGKLVRTIDELAARPRPDEPVWKHRLRRNVEALDRLEMPFAAWDRLRFGQLTSRDTHITAIRRRFPQVFGPPRELNPSVLQDELGSIPLEAPEC